MTGAPPIGLAHALRVTVDNDGSRMSSGATPSGVAVVAERLEALGGSVALEPSPLGGVRLIATLPDAPASVDSSA